MVGARGFPLRLIPSLGVRGGGLARIQNCSCAGGGGVRPKYLENSQKVQRQNPRHWALENRLGAVQRAILQHNIATVLFGVVVYMENIHETSNLQNNSKIYI